jgi:hypothetical protein
MQQSFQGQLAPLASIYVQLAGEDASYKPEISMERVECGPALD